MRLTKRQLKRIIREEKQKMLESFDDDQYGYGPPIEDLDEPGGQLSRIEDMVANEVEELLSAIQEEHSLEGEGISMDELNMAIARGVDRAKAILRY